jgi:hypothetical protein
MDVDEMIIFSANINIGTSCYVNHFLVVLVLAFVGHFMPNSPSGLGPVSQIAFSETRARISPHISTSATATATTASDLHLQLPNNPLLISFLLICLLILDQLSVAFSSLPSLSQNIRDEISDPTPRKQGFDAHTIEYSTENKWILEGFGYCDTS